MRRGTHQPPGLRRLQGVLASTQRKVATLANEQAALRVWRHALRIVAQSLCEIAQWRMARGVECGAELEELRQMLDEELQGSVGRAPANSSPSSSIKTGEGTGNDCPESNAVASVGSRNGDSSSSSRPPPPPQGCPPHLLSGESLIHLEGASPEDLALVRRGDVSELKALWQQWVKDALTLEMTPSPEAAQQLGQMGLRMQRLMSLMVFECYESFARFNATQCTSDQPAHAGGDGDLQHWQHVVRAMRPTRYQAQLMLEVNRMCDNCMAATRRRREGLIRRLQEVWVDTPAVRPPPARPEPSGDDGGAAGAGGETADEVAGTRSARRSAATTEASFGAVPPPPGRSAGSSPTQSAVADVAAQALGDTSLECWMLLERIEGTMRRDRAVLVLHHNAFCAVLTPTQKARFFSAAFPYPVNQPMVSAVMEAALRLRQDLLADNVLGAFDGANC